MKSRPVAVLLSLFLGFVGIQKFYLRQTWFGVMYVLLSFTFVPFIASLLEALVYACMSDKEFDERFNKGKTECPKPEKQEKEPIKIQIRFGNNDAPEIPQEKEAVTSPVEVESDANKTPAPVQASPAPVKFDANKIDQISDELKALTIEQIAKAEYGFCESYLSIYRNDTLLNNIDKFAEKIISYDRINEEIYNHLFSECWAKYGWGHGTLVKSSTNSNIWALYLLRKDILFPKKETSSFTLRNY